MSRKEVTVSNVSKKHDNQLQSWFRLPAGLTAILLWKVITVKLMPRASWELWHLIRPKE